MELNGARPVRVALAEDAADLRRLYVAYLKALGHDVAYAAENGAELLENFSLRSEEPPVDIVLLDLDMPVLDGLATAEELADRGIPVILLSGHPDAERVNLQEEPVALRIAKPVTLENLRTAIDAVLTGRNA